MTSNATYPQVFLDANALVKVAYSISHHHRDPKGRKSALRLFMERGVIAFSTGTLQFAKTIMLIAEGATETLGFKLSDDDRNTVAMELVEAVQGPRPLIELVSLPQTRNLDDCRRSFHEKLAESWYNTVDWDREDRMMILEASTAYAKYGLIKTRNGYYRPKPMILASDDKQVRLAAGKLDQGLRNAILETPCIEPLQSQLVNPVIHVISYAELKQLVQWYTS